MNVVRSVHIFKEPRRKFPPGSLNEKCSGVSVTLISIHGSLNGICSSVFVGNGFIRSERLVTIPGSLNGKCSIGTVGRVAWPQGPGNYCRALNGTMSRIPYGFVQPDIIQRKHSGIVTIRRGQAARPTVVSNVFPFNIPW